MAALNKFSAFVEALATKKHDLSADTLKLVLTGAAPSSGAALIGEVSEIAAGGGYAAGGLPVAVLSAAMTGGAFTLKLQDLTFTATGNVASFRYLVLVNATAGRVIGWIDRGAATAMLAGDRLELDFEADDTALVIG